MVGSECVRVCAGADPGFAKGGGADHGESMEREPTVGVWAEPPSESKGRAPRGGQNLKAFRLFSYKKGPKI